MEKEDQRDSAEENDIKNNGKMLMYIIIGKILNVYRLPLGIIILWIMLMVSIWGILASVFRNSSIWKWSNVVLFFMMIVIITYITLLSREGGTKEIILVPFHSFIEGQSQPEIYRTMLMNVFLFVPLGLVMPFALPDKVMHNQIITIIFACLLSTFVEIMQYCFRLGRCEADDVICNTLGAAIGTVSYLIYRKIIERKQRIRREST